MANIIASVDTKKKVIQNAWDWTLDNFHKLTEPNKIKIILAIIGKDMPTKLEGDVKGGEKVVILIKDKDENKGDGGRLPTQIPDLSL